MGVPSHASLPPGHPGVYERLFGNPLSQAIAPEALLLEARSEMVSLLRDIQRSCRSLAEESLHGALSTVYANVETIATSLDLASTTIPSPEQPLRVVLLGRTQAGKSTLFSYLTGTDASPVGDGAQRFTKSLVATAMAGQPGVLLVDTPGVGARDGAEDRQLALDAARSADLAVWVATSNSQPSQTAEALSQVAEWGVPMLLVLNCRNDLSGDEAIDQFLAYPESTFADLDGHLHRLAHFLDPHGQRPLQVLPVHAAAATLAAQTSPPHDELLRVSGVDALGKAIRTEAERHRHARRAAAIVDVARRALVDAVEQLTALADTLELWADTQRRAQTDFGKRASRLVADADLRLRSDITALFGRFDDWADRRYQGTNGEIEAMWDADARKLLEDADELLRATEEQLRRRLGRLDEEVAVAWSRRIGLSRTKPRHVRISGVAPRGIEAAARTTLDTVGGLVGAAIGQALWPAGGFIPGAAVGGLVAEWVGSRLVLRRRQLARRRTTLHEWVRSELAKIREEIEAGWTSTLESVERALKTSASERTRAALGVTDLAAHAHLLAEAADHAAASADRCLLRTLLRLAGRGRLADLVTAVHRTPGFVCLAPIPDSGLREFVLWPPDGMIEQVRPVPSGEALTACRRAAYALDAGARHTVLVPEEDGIRAHLSERLSPDFLAAEASIVSSVLDVPLRLTCATPDSMEAVA